MNSEAQSRTASRLHNHRRAFITLLVGVGLGALTIGSTPATLVHAQVGPGSSGSPLAGDLQGAQACFAEQLTWNGQPSPGVMVWWPVYAPPAVDGVNESPLWPAALPGPDDAAFQAQVNSWDLPAGVEPVVNATKAPGGGNPVGNVIAWFNPPATGNELGFPGPLAGGGGNGQGVGSATYGPDGYSYGCRPADSFTPQPPPQPGGVTIDCAALPTGAGFAEAGTNSDVPTPTAPCDVDGGMPPGTIPYLTASLPNGVVDINSGNRDFVVDVPLSGTATTTPWTDPVVANTYQIAPAADFTGTISILFYPIANDSGVANTEQSIPATGSTGHDSTTGSTYQWQWYSCSDPTSQWLTDDSTTARVGDGSASDPTISYSKDPNFAGLSPSADTYKTVTNGGQIYTHIFPGPGACGAGYSISAVQYWAVQCKAYFVWTQPVTGDLFDYDESSAVAFSSWATSEQELPGSTAPLNFNVSSQDLCNGKDYFEQTFTETAGPSGPPHPVVQFEAIGDDGAG